MAKTTEIETFTWEGRNKQGKKVSGEVTALSLILAKAELRKQGISPTKVKKKPKPLFQKKQKIKGADITVFTRQLATMLDAGVPMLQSLEILGRGLGNPTMQNLVMSMRADIEAGLSLSDALKKHPLYFNDLFCNLVHAGEQSGSLDSMLARIASYKEKSDAMIAKVKKTLYYPAAVIIIAFLITAGLLIFVIPQFQEVFSGFGADLPVATLFVISLSEFFQAYWWAIFGSIGIAVSMLVSAKRRSRHFAELLDRFLLRVPIIGPILHKAAVARFSRTLATTFAAGLPLVDALTAVSGATGNVVYSDATLYIREEVSVGQQIQVAMAHCNLFPSMVVQMIAIGEESGSLEFMLNKIADFYEEEVDGAVNSLSSLLEPLIMVILGVLIGGLVIAMYLPIFKLGGVV